MIIFEDEQIQVIVLKLNQVEIMQITPAILLYGGGIATGYGLMK